MALRAPRVLTALVAGGLVTGSVLLGAGTALAAPGGDVVPASCGQTVRAESGDTVRVTPAIGSPIVRQVVAGMDPITQLIGGVLCRVQVDVVAPVASSVARAAPPLAPAASRVSGSSGDISSPKVAKAWCNAPGMRLCDATMPDVPSPVGCTGEAYSAG